MGWLAGGLSSERHFLVVELTQHGDVVTGEWVHAQHGSSLRVQSVFWIQQAGHPLQSDRLNVIVGQEIQTGCCFLEVALGQAGGAQHQSGDLCIPSTLQCQQVNRQFFCVVPSPQRRMEQHFGFGLTDHVKANQHGLSAVGKRFIPLKSRGPIVNSDQFVDRSLFEVNHVAHATESLSIVVHRGVKIDFIQLARPSP